jgi:hypothetical protein
VCSAVRRRKVEGGAGPGRSDREGALPPRHALQPRRAAAAAGARRRPGGAADDPGRLVHAAPDQVGLGLFHPFLKPGAGAEALLLLRKAVLLTIQGALGIRGPWGLSLTGRPARRLQAHALSIKTG